MKIAVLMTCHNRRETTLRCLETLRATLRNAALQNAACQQFRVDVFLVDDGSTDGTGKAVSQWASAIQDSSLNLHLVPGSGSLFWARGMELAWLMALDAELQSGNPFSHFLWLNDDVSLADDALTKVLSCAQDNPNDIIVGDLVSPTGNAVTYGLRGDTFPGNFVLVPHAIYERVGIICGDYKHAWADSDYALRCKRIGIAATSCSVVGTCEWHPIRPSLRGLTLSQRWSMLSDPKGWCLHDVWLFRRRNFGRLAALFSCAHMVAHVLKGER